MLACSDRSRFSTWRFPQVGKPVPTYVQRAFRVKIFALLALQQAVCLAIMVLLRQFAWGGRPVQKSLAVEGFYYLLSFTDMVMIMQLSLIRNNFPYNYLLMSVMTCVAAVLWSLTESLFATLLHLELACMTCIAMGVASMMCGLLTRDDFKYLSQRAVPAALATGWFTASVVALLAARLTPLHEIIHIWEPWLASVLLGLLLSLMMFEARWVFFRSQPDDFMGILIILNGSMMSVVSIPSFVIIYGFLYMTRVEEPNEETDPRPQEDLPRNNLDDVDAAPAPAGPAASLSETSQRIDSRVTDLEKKIAKCDEDLRRYVGGKASAQQKQLALQCMKRKKMYEQQRDQILGTQFNVDSLAGAQEQAEINIMTVEAMKVGHQDLKERYEQIGGVMDIEKLMDNMADLNDEIADINEAISTSYAVPDGFDESSFEAELDTETGMWESSKCVNGSLKQQIQKSAAFSLS
ncbi:chmp5 [Symbiodinium pilosum]|uniref:Chmp5 protein n=1 Tax=Symbiodinium pilosum TaxID=2952 RepID=A0A812XD81_SYMPI|nr:chmp5 [Symbiodinium pilosum]